MGLMVQFVTRGSPHLASYRLRIASPAGYLRGKGVGVGVGGFEPADVHVFSKHWDAEDLENALRSPCPVFDLCDDHFSGAHGVHYRLMCERCSVVCSSRRLVERVLEETGKAAVYIPEAWEYLGPSLGVREPSSDPICLWFGHSSNLSTLGTIVPRLGKLIICTNAQGRGIVPYSPGALWKCLEACDIVIIPQEKDWKSANRLVQSLHYGRFVVASDIPSYRGFDQYLGDILEGVDWVRQNAGHITERIISGRSAISSFAPESVGRMWLNYISDVAKRSSVATST